MKKRLAAISSILVFSLLLSSCGQPANNKKRPFDDDNTTPSTAIPTPMIPMGKPTHDLTRVDVKATYDDFYVDDFCPPEPFGDDEDTDDYVFFAITAPK